MVSVTYTKCCKIGFMLSVVSLNYTQSSRNLVTGTTFIKMLHNDEKGSGWQFVIILWTAMIQFAKYREKLVASAPQKKPVSWHWHEEKSRGVEPGLPDWMRWGRLEGRRWPSRCRRCLRKWRWRSGVDVIWLFFVVTKAEQRYDSGCSRNTNWKGRLSTVDLLFRVAHFVRK
jgi:hypothetical protein